MRYLRGKQRVWYLFLPGDIYRLGYIVSCPQRLVIDSSFDNSTVNEFGIKRVENKRQKVNEQKVRRIDSLSGTNAHYPSQT